MRSRQGSWGRLLLPSLVVLVSLGLLLYGTGIVQRTIYQSEEEGTALLARSVSEFEMVLDATAGGLERHGDGRLVRTYKTGEGRGEECPT